MAHAKAATKKKSYEGDDGCGPDSPSNMPITGEPSSRHDDDYEEDVSTPPPKKKKKLRPPLPTSIGGGSGRRGGQTGAGTHAAHRVP